MTASMSRVPPGGSVSIPLTIVPLGGAAAPASPPSTFCGRIVSLFDPDGPLPAKIAIVVISALMTLTAFVVGFPRVDTWLQITFNTDPDSYWMSSFAFAVIGGILPVGIPFAVAYATGLFDDCH